MPKTKQQKPESHAFTLILSGASEPTEAIANALFEAGCDDALLGSRDGVTYMDFDREAGTLREAVLSAIGDAERAGFGLLVARVEPDELVSTAEIARRTGRTRESIRLYALGQRGPGGFPPPVSGLKTHSPRYRWTDVAAWWADHLSESAAPALRDAKFIGGINAVLELRNQGMTAGDAIRLLRSLFRSPDPRGRSKPSAKKPAPPPPPAKKKTKSPGPRKTAVEPPKSAIGTQEDRPPPGAPPRRKR